MANRIFEGIQFVNFVSQYLVGQLKVLSFDFQFFPEDIRDSLFPAKLKF